jgi:GNAT superfamily N-acetyltransferase
MQQPFFHVRGSHYNDANYLLDIDLKCFEQAWSPDAWQALGNSRDTVISVATNFGTPVGFAVLRIEQRDVVILKMAVKPVARRKGVSRRLLDAARQFATENHAEWLRITVPESTIYPGPNNLSDWLKAIGFKAITPFIKDHFNVYGETEDGVQFISKLGEPHEPSYPN